MVQERERSLSVHILDVFTYLGFALKYCFWENVFVQAPTDFDVNIFHAMREDESSVSNKTMFNEVLLSRVISAFRVSVSWTAVSLVTASYYPLSRYHLRLRIVSHEQESRCDVTIKKVVYSCGDKINSVVSGRFDKSNSEYKSHFLIWLVTIYFLMCFYQWF